MSVSVEVLKSGKYWGVIFPSVSTKIPVFATKLREPVSLVTIQNDVLDDWLVLTPKIIPIVSQRCGHGSLQAFARLSAVHGGTYMLGKPDCKVSETGHFFLDQFCILVLYLGRPND